MLKILKLLLKPLKTKNCMISFTMKTVVTIFFICWLIIASNNVAAAAAAAAATLQQQPQTLNYKQQLQYQIQQHDKFEYQQQIKQQQQYYHQQYHQQQAPTSMALLQEQQQQQHQQEQQKQRLHQQQQQYLAVKPSQMLQTAASLVVDDGTHSEALTLGQPEYSNGSAQRRRPGNRKRKRRPQSSATAEGIDSPTASNAPPPYWRGQVDDEKEDKSSATKGQDNEDGMRPAPQASFKRRKQPAIREPLAALEKEQKLYEMRNKPESAIEGNTANRNSANLKNILKNSGGLSLSEILQQKNLSLDDLLKGKQNALQALQTTASSPQEKVNHAKYPSFKGNYKPNISSKQSEGSSEDVYNSKEKSKLTALHRLKLFGSSSRPSGIQVGLADHLTTRKREGGLYSTTTSSTTTSTTAKPSTTKIPLYKKILHQRPTLKPTFLLKNTAVIASAQPERMVNSWDSKEQMEEGTVDMKEADEDMEQMEEEDWKGVPPSIQIFSTKQPESTDTTTWKWETTMAPTTTTTSSTTTSTAKPITEKSANRDLTTSTRRMYTSTRGSGRTTYRYTTSTTTPATTTTTSTTTTTTSTTTTPQPVTTTSTTSTTTASSSTMNLTPKANLNLNTEDLRERIQETLLKNLIEKEDSFKKSSSGEENDHDENGDDDDDDLENFFEETIKPKTTKYFETSTITTRMKQYTPSSYSTSTAQPQPSTTPTANPNIIPDFDNVDDRTDLLELIEDRRSGNRLFKVLEQRNMTLEELIEHRKRGSSQLHLATIVETPSRFYPDKKVVLQDNMDIVTAFENFPHFNLLNLKSVKPDDIKTDSQGSSYFTSIIDIEPTDEVYRKRNGVPGISGELDKASLLPDRSEKSLGFFPSWKTLALASLGNNKDADNKRKPTNRNPYYLQQPKMLLENNLNNERNDNDDDDVEDLYDIKENELTLMAHDDVDADDNEDDYQAQNPIQAAVRLPEQTAEAIENEVARAHDLVDLELSGHGFKRSPQAAGALAHSHRHGSFYTNMPPGIKSAIVASATIVLTALVTFMVIFAVCKWKQRRHRMSNIMKSYNAMKSKLPTIATAAHAAVASTNSSTNPNSRRSSLREMQDLLGGSGLSVAATITTTSSGVPNTPIHHHHNLTPSPQLTNSSQTTTTAATMLAGNCSKNINGNFYNHHQHTNNSNSNNSSKNSSCGLRPLQQQSSLLFQRSFNQNHNNSSHNQHNSNSNSNNNDKPTNLSILSGCNLLDLKRNNKMNGSTTSLSFSLTSGHNISNSHINTMDANSPEVQEYLFDTLRNSY